MMFVLLLLLSTVASWAKCLEGWTNLPPYYSYGPDQKAREYYFLYGKTASSDPGRKAAVSVGKIFEGYPENGNYRLVKKNSLVKALQPVPNEKTEDLIMVEILSEKGSSKYLDALVGLESEEERKMIVAAGEKGFISPNNLKPSTNKDVLMVTRDTFVLKTPEDTNKMALKYGEGLRPIVSDSQYKVMNCDGKLNYLFSLLSPDSSRNKKEIEIADLSCIPNQMVQEDQFLDIQKLIKKARTDLPEALSIEVNEWGLVRLPVDPQKSYTHFRGSDPIGTDDWGRPDTVCSLIDIASGWKNECEGPGCTPQIGDIGFMTPTLLEDGRDPLGHLQHSDGSCIDMRPFRKDQKMLGVNLDKAPQEYDRERTQKFISHLIKMGATPVYFNDPEIVKSSNPGRARTDCDLKNPKNDEKQGVFHCEGHSDHIHFCLRKPFVKGC